MKRGVAIKVEKDLLSWARKAIGYSLEEAAKKTKLAAEQIEHWETESSDITVSDIKKLAKVYKRQLSFFFLPTPPTEKPIPDDFRTLDSVRQEDIPQKVRLAIRRAQNNRRTIKDLFETDYELKINKAISLEGNPTAYAAAFRGFFSLSIEDQFALKDEKESLSYWVEAVEQKGIFVFQMELDENFRGFCLRDGDLPPVIVINVKDARTAKAFTLIHELCHLYIKQSEIDALIYSRGEERAHRTIEAFANEFSGSFLVPNEDLKKEDYFKKYRDTKSSEHISRLANRFNVSELVILRRMYALAVITKSEYEKEKKLLDEKYEQIRANQKAKLKAKLLANPDSFVPRNIPKETIQKLGLSLSAKSFQAVSDGRMTTFELVKFLDIKTRHLDGVKGLIEKRYNSLT